MSMDALTASPCVTPSTTMSPVSASVTLTLPSLRTKNLGMMPALSAASNLASACLPRSSRIFRAACASALVGLACTSPASIARLAVASPRLLRMLAACSSVMPRAANSSGCASRNALARAARTESLRMLPRPPRIANGSMVTAVCGVWPMTSLRRSYHCTPGARSWSSTASICM
jgi:hypothetical protein